MFAFLAGFALAAVVFFAAWFLSRKYLPITFTLKGVKWLFALLAVLALTGCASVGQTPKPNAKTQPANTAATAPNFTDPQLDALLSGAAPAGVTVHKVVSDLGSVSNPVFFRCASLDAIAAIVAKDRAEREQARALAVFKDEATDPKKPAGSIWGAYFWRRASFDAGALCGAAAFGVVWWFLLKKSSA